MTKQILNIENKLNRGWWWHILNNRITQ